MALIIVLFFVVMVSEMIQNVEERIVNGKTNQCKRKT
jgi:hypothetical protein